MGTNCTIILQKPDSDDYESIYCHYDGYLAHVGATLLQHYSTDDQVQELIALGDISGLGISIEFTESYHSRGERLRINRSFYLGDHCHCQYAYMFKDGKWFVAMGDNKSRNFRPLSSALPID